MSTTPDAMEKAAIKRTMAHEGRFREEKQRIVESLGGSRAELVTPFADARIQRKVKDNSGTSTVSSLLSESSARGFQADDEDRGPEDLPTDEDIPRALDHREVLHEYDTEEQRCQCPKFKKSTHYITAAVIILVVIGATVGAVVNNAGTSSTSMNDEGIEPSIADDGMCKLDREALAKCENGMLTLPDCAADTYLDLANAYSDLLVLGAENECDAAHKGLVALAVSQTNHARNVADPIMFFAISTLYFALEGTQWRTDTNWLEGSSPCSSINGAWYGVECSGDEPLVSVSLENNLLRGSLPTEIGLLSNLKDLVIGVNEISGPLPSEIGLLAKLWTLDISLTSIHSELPSEIGMLKELTRFKTVGAPLVGSIPSEIGNMIKLEELHLARNFFTGTLPTELGNLIQLHELYLESLIGITGTIPLDLVSLTRLEVVAITLPGVDPSPFPAVVSLATNLRFLDIRDSHVTGSIPTISHLSNLQEIGLSDLFTTGTIPTEIGLVSDLVIVLLNQLNFQGTIPTEVGLLAKLTSLRIRGNSRITGALPSELGSLTVLEYLDVESTGLEGTIPHEVCELKLQEKAFLFDDCEIPSFNTKCGCFWGTCGSI